MAVATLLLVHAHPDDESIWTGGVTLRAHAEGHRVVLVTATRGEEGIRDGDAEERPADVRSRELRRACRVLGVDRHAFLGYRDSGMRGPEGAPRPAFAAAPLVEAAQRLAAVIEEERPEVVVTYGRDGTYGHPDHCRAHHVTLTAIDLLRPAGWWPRKLYLHAVPRSTLRRVGELVRRAGGATREMRSFLRIPGTPDEELTTVVDVRDPLDGKLRAFAEHRSQYERDRFFQETGRDVLEAAFGREAFILACGEPGEPPPERSLFSGL